LTINNHDSKGRGPFADAEERISVFGIDLLVCMVVVNLKLFK